MPTYYVNDHAQSNGDHIVHKAWCVWFPYIKSKVLLGYFPNCREAIEEAKKYYTKVNGCEICSAECHDSG